MLELSGNASIDVNLESITPRTVLLAVQGDEELDTLWMNGCPLLINRGGTIPHIHRDLIGSFGESRKGRKDSSGNDARAANEALDAWVRDRAETAVVDPRDGKHYALMGCSTLVHLPGMDLCCSLSAEQRQAAAQNAMGDEARALLDLATSQFALRTYDDHDYDRGTLALREIRRYQKDCENLLERNVSGCHHLCIEMAAELSPDMKWTPEALQTLLFGLEARIVAVMENAQRNFALQDNKRLFVNANDVKLAATSLHRERHMRCAYWAGLTSPTK